MNIYGNTDIGCVRKDNEDDYGYLQNKNNDWIALVCDGIGGSAAGEIASKIAIETMLGEFEKAPVFSHDFEVHDWIHFALNKANDAIYERSNTVESEKGMGTTCVGIIVTNNNSYIFNVGDSRIYADYKDGLILMSEDHSVVARLLRDGDITPEQAQHHAQRNTLTNALGIWRVFQIDVNKIDPSYRYILLSSDGLHGYVEHDVIESCVEDDSLSIQEKVETLIQRANAQGGFDNCTVVLLENNGDVQ